MFVLWPPTKMLLLENPSYKHEIKLKTLVNRDTKPLLSFMNADRFYFRCYLIKMRGGVGGDVCGQT